MDAMLITRPRSRRTESAACVTNATLFRSVSTTVSQPASSSDTRSVGMFVPALLTRMSIVPHSRATRAKHSRLDPTFRTSKASATDFRPFARIALATGSAPSAFRDVIATSAPASASASAIARPMPRPPPVTTARLPLRSNSRLTAWQDTGDADRGDADPGTGQRGIPRRPDPGRARLSRAIASRGRARPRRAPRVARGVRRPPAKRRHVPLPERDRRRPPERLARRRRARRFARTEGRDHRTDRSQDGDQRAELRRLGLHGRLRRREHADLAQHGRRSAEPHRRRQRNDLLQESRRARVQARREDRYASRPPTRLASRGAAPDYRWRSDLGGGLRLRAVRLPQREAVAGTRERALLLSAKDGEPPRGATLEPDLRLDREGARPRPREDQGHGARRGPAARVRDGGDALRASRTQRRVERGTL